MLRFLTGEELSTYPALQDSMFRDRARQFRDRLQWQVRVDEQGWERDEYDPLNPVYVIWQMPDGLHGGSMRFLPTTGPTMVNDHFSHLAAGMKFSHPRLWECTRFCVSERAPNMVSSALMLGAAQLGCALGLRRAIGVFDARMVRIYRRLGWEPVVLGSQGEGAERISLGFWEFSDQIRRHLARRVGIAPELVEGWYRADRAQGDPLAQTR